MLGLEPVEVLQTITLAFVGFTWSEIREMRKDLANARERLSAVEKTNPIAQRRK